MAHYLVTGRSGTGKTAIWKELVRRGYPAFDGDKIPEMAGWIHKTTGEYLGKKYPGDVTVMSYAWIWDKKVLSEVLAQHSDVFICGNANNASDFYGQFDRVFILSLAEEEHRRRINQRTEHDFGKDPQVQDKVIKGQKEMVKHALLHGATAIDATPPVDQIVNTLLSNLGYEH